VNPTPDQRDIEALPFSRLAGQFRRSRQGNRIRRPCGDSVVPRWSRFRSELVPAAQIDATIGICPTIEFDMQLEIFKLGIMINSGPFRTYQATSSTFHTVVPIPAILPSRQIFSVKQGNGLPPLRGTLIDLELALSGRSTARGFRLAQSWSPTHLPHEGSFEDHIVGRSSSSLGEMK